MATPLRVLHLIGARKPGGAETFALRLFKALHAHAGAEQTILCRKGWLAARLAEAGVPCHTAPFGGWWDTPFTNRLCPWLTHATAQRLATQVQPHVVLAWMNRGVRFMPVGPWARAARLGGFYDLKYYRGRVTELIGNTPEIVQYCQTHGWPAAHTHLLPNFIPAPTAGWEAARPAQRAAWGWQAADFGLVQMGRLHPNKGCETSLHALSQLPPFFKLAFVGSGPDEAELKALAQRLGVAARVQFAGWQNDITPMAAAADAWLAPSRHEPLGNTAIDAWVHGVPLVVSAVGGLDTLVEDGVHGLKVPPEDPAALAMAIGALQASPALQTKVRKNGQARWLAEFSESKIVSEYLALFAKLAKTA